MYVSTYVNSLLGSNFEKLSVRLNEGKIRPDNITQIYVYFHLSFDKISNRERTKPSCHDFKLKKQNYR